MSVDKTLKLKDALSRHRNVLTRAERIAQMERTGSFDESENSPFGLPKTRVLKTRAGGKKKKKKKEDDADK